MTISRTSSLILVLGLLAACNFTPAPSQTLTPAVETTPTMHGTSTITPTQTPTETPSPTEDLRFQELLPATIEECIQNNELRADHWQEDLNRLRELELAAMSPNIEDYPTTGTGAGSPATADRLNIVSSWFRNPRMSSCSYVDFGEGREFLILGFYINSSFSSAWGVPEFDRYTMPIHFAFDMNLLQMIETNAVTYPDVRNSALFYSNEANYRELTGNQSSARVDIYGVFPSLGQVLPSDSLDVNLEWLNNYQNNLSDRFLHATLEIRRSSDGVGDDEVPFVHEWASHWLIPAAFITLEHR